MSFIITLVASDPSAHPMDDAACKEVIACLQHNNHQVTAAPVLKEEGKAAEIGIGAALNVEQATDIRQKLWDRKIDVFCTPAAGRRKKLLLADMDSTIVSGETLDDLAGELGLKDHVAEIIARAMNGEIPFDAALRERVMLLKDMYMATLDTTAQSMVLNPGAKEMVMTMRGGDAMTVLVTGGFTCFAERAAAETGFHHFHSNVLDIDQGRLTGKVGEPILDKTAKLEFLKDYLRQYNLKPEDAMTIGDGANDLPMLEAAGLGIGYHPKGILRDRLVNVILHGDLTAALYAQGYASIEFTSL